MNRIVQRERFLLALMASLVLGVAALHCAPGSTASTEMSVGTQSEAVVVRPVISETFIPILEMAPVAEDGFRGEGFLRKPPGDGPFPAVVLIHGGLFRRPTQELREYALSTHPSRFLEAGYAVAVITYRSRDADPTAQSPMPISDCVAAVEYLKSLPFVDPESIVVTGASGGGDLTLEVASRTQVAAIAPEEPASVLMAGLVVADSRVARAADYIELYRAQSDHRPFQQKLARIEAPMLILQGTHNTHSGLNRFSREVLIPELLMTERLLEIITFPDEPHAFSFYSDSRMTPNPAAAQKAFHDIDAFFKRFIPTQPVPLDPARVRHVEIERPAS